MNTKAIGADFLGCKLHRAIFTNADLRNSCFTKASLVRASLRRANLDYAHLIQADLRGINRVLKLGRNLLAIFITFQQLSNCQIRNAQHGPVNLLNGHAGGSMVFSIYAVSVERLSLVTCADKRITINNPITGRKTVFDNFVKIHRSGLNAVYFGTGQPIEYVDGSAAFDAIALAGQYLQEHPTNSSAFDPDALQELLLDELKKRLFWDSQHARTPETRMEGSDPIFYTIGLFFWTGSGFRKLDFEVLYEKATPPRVSAKREDRTPLLFDANGGGPELLRVFRNHEPDLLHYFTDFPILEEHAHLWDLGGKSKTLPPLGAC